MPLAKQLQRVEIAADLLDKAAIHKKAKAAKSLGDETAKYLHLSNNAITYQGKKIQELEKLVKDFVLIATKNNTTA
jgi:hypothetical protein